MTDCVSQQSIQLVADELGLDVEGVAPMVASEVEMQLRYLVQDMVRYMSMSKRTKLTVQDTQSALRLRGQDGTYGYSATDPNLLMQHENKNAKAYPQRDETLVFVRDTTVNLHSLASTSSGGGPVLPKVPTKPTFSIHWLGIGGVQPTINENPPAEAKAAGRIGNIKSRIGSSGPQKRARTNGPREGGVTNRSGEVAVKKVSKHALSQELQLYYEKVVAAVRSSVVNPAATVNVFSSVSSDRGLQALLPYFSQFVSETVNNNLRNHVLLTSVMRLARCILVNPHLKDMDLYLHQLMPAVLTCVVGKRLCQKPTDDHWSLRELAASLLHLILSRFGEAYGLQPRITKTLNAVILDKKKPLTTKFGAIVGMTVIGDLAVENFLLAMVPDFSVQLLREIAPWETVSSSTQAVAPRGRNKAPATARLEALHCYAALQSAVGRYLKHGAYVHGVNPKLKSRVERAAEVFGETLLPVHESSEGQCGLVGDVFL